MYDPTSDGNAAARSGRVLMDLLHSRKLTLATAESCTAGRLAAFLSDLRGAGSVLLGGIVAYQKTAKQRLLGVAAEAMAGPCGAVSGETAEAMALGALEAAGADVAAAITGVAGPQPDEDGNPVGRVCIAVALRGQAPVHRCFAFGSRSHETICEEAVAAALRLLIERLERQAA